MIIKTMPANNTNKVHIISPGISLLLLVYAAFIALGMPDGMFGVAWPTMRKGFGIPIDAVGMSMIAGTAGYLLSSFFSGRLIAKISIGGLLTLSCALTGATLITYCLVPSWMWYVSAGLVSGFGAGGIDAGLNTYMAANSGNRQMHWMHACYGIGITTGPFIMTAGLQTFRSWRPGYLATGSLQILLAAAFAFSMRAWNRFDAANRGAQRKKLTDYDTPLLKTLAYGPALAGMLLFLLCSGTEASLGFWAYSILTEARGVAPVAAGILAGGYFAMFTVSRILSGIYAKHIQWKIIVFGCIILALAGSLLLRLKINPVISMAGMVIAGFAIAPIFPAMVSGTSSRVGDSHASNAIGMQMSAASIGSACIPALMGILARRFSVEAITGAIIALFAVILLVFIAALRIEVKDA